MSVIILLNGHEEAMRPQTATMPWPLLEVAGGTLASYLLLFLAEVLDGRFTAVNAGWPRFTLSLPPD